MGRHERGREGERVDVPGVQSTRLVNMSIGSTYPVNMSMKLRLHRHVCHIVVLVGSGGICVDPGRELARDQVLDVSEVVGDSVSARGLMPAAGDTRPYQ